MIDLANSWAAYQFFCTVSNKITSAFAFEVVKGGLFNGDICMIDDSSGPGKENGQLIAGIVELVARSDLMMVCSVCICMPHSRVMMQIGQPKSDLEDVDAADEDDSR